MKLGYYFTNSKYGDDYRSVRSYAPIYRCARSDYETSKTSVVESDNLFVKALVKAASFKHTQIVLALDWERWGFDAVDVIGLVNSLGLWNRVIALELDDEPGWSQTEAKRIRKFVRDFLDLEDLLIPGPEHGMGVVEHQSNILNTTGWKVFDWVGLEGYVSPPGSPTASGNRAQLRSSMIEQFNRIPDGMPFVWVLQGYDRNFGWKNIDTLAELQADSFSLMRSKPFKDRILPFALAFAYSRPGGTKHHPALRAAHRAYVYGTRTRADR